MRLWHEQLIQKLPRQQLLGQWRECLALLGNGWAKKHKTVDYIFQYSDSKLLKFAGLVYNEMILRGYKPKIERVTEALHRRKNCTEIESVEMIKNSFYETSYPEHDAKYLLECVQNLNKKGIELTI